MGRYWIDRDYSYCVAGYTQLFVEQPGRILLSIHNHYYYRQSAYLRQFWKQLVIGAEETPELILICFADGKLYINLPVNSLERFVDCEVDRRNVQEKTRSKIIFRMRFRVGYRNKGI